MTNKIYKACANAIAEFPQRLVSYLMALMLLMMVAGQAHAVNNAQYVSQVVPTTMVAGQTYSVSVTMKNTGTGSWTVAAGYILGAQNPEGNFNWGMDRMPLVSTIAVNYSKTFTATVTAPSTPGPAHFQWQMVQDNVEFFGQMSPDTIINVVPATYNAEFVSQTASYSTVAANAAFTYTVTMKNTGNTTWKAGRYSLADVDGDSTWGIFSKDLTTTVAPGANGVFSLSLRAPVEPSYYSMQWRMLLNGEEWFGAPTTARQIGVLGPPPMVAVDSPLSGAEYIIAAGKINVPVFAYAIPTGAATISKIQVLTISNSTYVELGSAVGDVLDKTLSISSGYRTIYIRATDSFGKYTQVPITLVPIADGASFVSQVVPAKMIPGQPYDVALTLKNTGGTVWDPETFRLTAQTPAGNVTWGSSSLPLPGAVWPGETVVINATVMGPPTVGNYTFQWRMSQDTRGAFGSYTTAVSVVNARPLPIVSMAAPTNGETFPVPTATVATIAVQGTAEPAPGATISKIEVLDGTTVVATTPAGWIDMALTLTPGTHALKLRATDNWGMVGYGPVNTVKVLANAATYVSQSVPTTMVSGRTYSTTVTMRNSGTTTWTPWSFYNPEGYALGGQNPVDNDVWRVRVPTGVSVAPNSTHTFPISVIAPPPGTYNFQWQMLQEGHEWFGAMSPNVQVVVKPEAPSALVLASPLGGSKVIGTAGKAVVPFRGSVVAGEWNAIAKLELLDSSIVLATTEGESIEGEVLLANGFHNLRLRATDVYGQVVYSAYNAVTVQYNGASFVLNEVPTTMVAGQSLMVGVTMRNSGSSMWSAAEHFVLGVQPEGNTTWTSTSTPIIDDVVNPNTAHFVWQITAPAEPGTYPFQWQMRHDDKEWFGAKSTIVNVVVTAAPPTATMSAPLNNTTYSGYGSTVTVPVQGSGKAVGNASITKLEVLDGTTVIATVNSGTINTSVQLAGGNHILKLRATDSRGNTGLSAGVTAIVLHNSSSFVSQSVPTAMIGGERYTVTVTMKNTANTTWQPFNAATRQGFALASQNPADNTTWRADNRVPLAAAVAPNGNAVFTFDVIAPMASGTYNFQWRMLEEGRGEFGALSTNVAVVVTVPPGPSATLTATPGNIRVQAGQTAAITLTGSGTHTEGLVTKLEVFQDTGSGYAETPVLTLNGSAASLALDQTLQLPYGSHRLKLRATDAAGRTGESAPTIVNVADNRFLGGVLGIRTANDKVELGIWVLRDPEGAPLPYSIYVNAPSVLGGTLVASGTLGSTGTTQSTGLKRIQEVEEEYWIDVTDVNTGNPGAPVSPEVQPPGGGAVVVLPADGNSAVMPGNRRIGLTSPSPSNADRVQAPTPVFLRAITTDYNGPASGVRFNVDNNWLVADTVRLVEGGNSAYELQVFGLPPRATPYVVYAEINESNTVSDKAQFHIDEGSSVSLLGLSNGQTLTAGDPFVLTAQPAGYVVGMQGISFYANGDFIGAGVKDGDVWKYEWAPRAAGAYSVHAKALDGTGGVMSQSAAVAVTVLASSDPASDGLQHVSITPTYLNAPNAGTLPGDLNVTPDGAAAYSIPLVVPPGAFGMQPSLSLNYSSAGQNGIVGLGWSLGGMSSIHRCGKTIAQDGVNARIGFGKADRLCLDGQRLVLFDAELSDDNYWASGAVYRTEIDGFSRVTSLVVGTARTFKVETKDGRTMIYGMDGQVTAYAAFEAGQKLPSLVPRVDAQSWALFHTTDRIGNFITYQYEQNAHTGEHLLKTIRYGAKGKSAHAAVGLSYTGRADSWTRYIDETRNDLRSRVDHIKTYVGDDLSGELSDSQRVRDYALTYEASPTSGRSLLSSVQVCARNPGDAADECMPKTSFAWGKPSATKTAGFESKGTWAGAPILTTWRQAEMMPVGVNHADYFAFADFRNLGYTDVLEKRVANMSLDVSEDGNTVPVGTKRTQYRYFHNTGTGFTEYKYGLNLSPAEPFVVLDTGDFDGDGLLDLLVSTDSGAKICLSPLGSASALADPAVPITFTCDSTRPATGSNSVRNQPFVVDVFGDGRASHYGRMGYNGAAMRCIQKETCVEDGAPPSVLGYAAVNSSTPEYAAHSYTSFTQFVDFSGVGKPQDVRWTKPYYAQYLYEADIKFEANAWQNLRPTVVIGSIDLSDQPSSAMNDYSYAAYPAPSPQLPQVPYQFDAPAPGGTVSGDFNGTGYQGLAFGFLEFSYPQGVRAYNKAEFTLCLSTGRSLDCSVRQKYSGANYRSVRAIGNFVGDGMPGALVETMTYPAGLVPARSGKLEMCRIMGDDVSVTTTGGDDSNMVCKPWPGLVMPPLAKTNGPGDQVYFMDLLGTGRQQLVYYHSGYINASNVWQEDGRWEVFAPIDVAETGQALDRIYKVTNGLGGTSSVEYADGLPSGAVTRTGETDLAATYPQHMAQTPGKVVNRLNVDIGISGHRSVDYKYSDAAIDVEGRGALGYGTVVSTDTRSGIVTTTRYSHTWPNNGMVRSVKVMSAGGKKLSETVNELKSKKYGYAGGRSVYFPYVGTSTVSRWDLDAQHSALGTVTTANTYGDEYGNLTEQEVTTADDEKTFKTKITTIYSNNATAWLLGLPTKVTTTKTDPSDVSLTRTTTYTHDSTTGLLSKEIAEEGDQAYELVTEYTRDAKAFGQVGVKKQTWYDPQSKAARSRDVATMTYDDFGRYPVTMKNALGHQESYTYYPATGVRKSLTGAHDRTTTWTADGFGRVTVEKRPDGNETRNYVRRCPVFCNEEPSAATVQITQQYHGNKRMSVPQVVFSDSVGHVLRTESYAYNGAKTYVARKYDDWGRLNWTGMPEYANDGTAEMASSQEYDELSRVTKTTVLDDVGAEQSSTVLYNGLTTAHTNALNKTRKEKRNVIGQVESVEDAGGGVTSFSYDPFGNLAKTIDPNKNVIAVEYDRLGRKTALVDPDLGRIEYTPDPLGRVLVQSSQVQRDLKLPAALVNFTYDDLDRMIVRAEYELRSEWKYDSATHGEGQLAEAFTGTAALKDYVRVHTYDTLGRPVKITHTLSGGTYSSETEYDGWSRVLSQTHQRDASTADAKRFGLRYSDMGYLHSVMRGELALWKVEEQDVANRPTKIALGNGLMQKREYSVYSGRLTGGEVLTAAQEVRLLEGYIHDAVGNVTTRSQSWNGSGFIEQFTYDKLNRLGSSTIGSATQTFNYYDDGSIKNKTGVGTGDYKYPTQGVGAIRPHAVESIAGIDGTFQYDNNGNLLSGAGRTMTWTSFDMPKSIVKGAESSTFFYGSEHQRTRQDRGDGVSIVYAGAQEVEIKAGIATVRTYWPQGIGLEIDVPSKPTELIWKHVDRLGSPVAITDITGKLLEELAYDAWGKRRHSTTNTTPDSLDGSVDRRGYTGHEMLDQLDLVHMNGRVYDPFTAKFLSGDPIIQDPMDGQNYSRYSYVLNNPTNLTDPTGFSAEEDLQKREAREQRMKDGAGWQELGEGGATSRDGKKLDSNGNPVVNSKVPTNSANNGAPIAGGTPGGCQTSVDCRGKGNGYDTSDPNHHEYRNSNGICKEGTPGCTVQNVYESVTRNAAPGSDGVTPVKTGDKTGIVFGGVQGGHVTHIVDPANTRVINITDSDHVFYKGLVIRSVVSSGGTIFVPSHGEGVNSPTSSSLLNSLSKAVNLMIAIPGFSIQDRKIQIDVLSQSAQGRLILMQQQNKRLEAGQK